MSAKVAIQKFSFPFSCAVHLPPQDEVTQTGCVQAIHDLQENPVKREPNLVAVVGAVVQDDTRAPESQKGLGQSKVVDCAEAQSAVVCRRSVFEKLTLENEDQRPAAKRQLSSESAARTISVVKKSAVRKEVDLKVKPHLVQQVSSAAKGKRRCRKDLFTSSEVFHRVDSHAIRAGAEVMTFNIVIHELHNREWKHLTQIYSPSRSLRY